MKTNKGMRLINEMKEFDVEYEDVKQGDSEYTITVERGYDSLFNVLHGAFKRASKGKGHERHGKRYGDFDHQPIVTIQQLFNSIDWPLGEASKKAQECKGMLERGEWEAAIKELEDSIVYIAAAIRKIQLDHHA